MDSNGLTKTLTAVLIAIIVVASVAGGAAYVLLSGSAQPSENIRIGVCADLNSLYGKTLWQGAVLAAEQINAEGGILGRNLTVVSEDDDSTTMPVDAAVGINALTKLITVDKADYIMSMGGLNVLAYQDVCCEHKKIFISTPGIDEYSQRVLDNYEKYKYSFAGALNNTINSALMLGQVIAIANYTGFTKVALLFDDMPMAKTIATSLSASLPEHGLEVVYNGVYAFGTTDFTSYFATIEASGAEILFSWIVAGGEVPFVKEWHDRQSPLVIWGLPGVAYMNFWELTEGKCDAVSFIASPAVAGYPLTSKTMPFRDAYIKRWSEAPRVFAFAAYDTLRFILADAIKRAGTTETEAVIKALERTDVETTSERHFVFTSSHDVMVVFKSPNNPSEEYSLNYCLQWQNGTQVPVYPESIMREAGGTYKYPTWQGPWSNNPAH